MEYVRNTNHQFADAAPQAAETDFGRWRSQITEAADQAFHRAIDLGELCDRLFGAEPRPAEKSAERGEPHCEAAALDSVITRLFANLDEISAKINRLRRLA